MTNYRGDPRVYEVLNKLNIPFEYYEHPPVPTVKEAEIYWKDIRATHCKNLFFRNHKGDKHYLVIFEYSHNIQIRDLEQRLKQGKLSFASDQRLMKFLGLRPGSVSPFGLINDLGNHVHLFLDENLEKSEKISFHPNLNTASLVIPYAGFRHFLDLSGNTFEFIKLYD
jgi:Ala-tRNA(Pro) deacylase